MSANYCKYKSKVKRSWCLCILFCTFFFIFLNIGNIITVKDKPEKADAIFFLMGSLVDRVEFSNYLLQYKFTKKIVLVDPSNNSRQYFRDNNILIPSDPDLIKGLLFNKGIDSSIITVLPGPSSSTLDEALAFYEYCKQNEDLKKVLLVTSSYHSGRARYIFNRVFSNGGKFIQFSVPYNIFSNYSPEYWYLYEASILFTITETLKWVSFICWKQWFI